MDRIRIRRAPLLAPVIAGLLSALAASPAAALVRFDFEQPYLVLPGRYMKDHSFVRRAGEWHAFMIVGSDDSIGWSAPGNEISFAHVSTKDFRHWAIHADVCGIGTGAWDGRNIWAPKVIAWRGRYRMYYTGVDSSVTQRMGLASSRDLFDWQPSTGNPLYHPDTTWAAWGAGAWSDCRDPYLWSDGDLLYALNTARTADGRGALDRAVSRDGVSWTDLGPLCVNDSAATLESAQLLERAGSWYLFFNLENRSGLFVLRAADARGPWNPAARRLLGYGQPARVFGGDRDAAAGAEAGTGDLLSRCARYRDGMGRTRYVLRVDSLAWDASGNPRIADDDAFWRDWSPVRRDDPRPAFGATGREILATDRAFSEQPTFGENPSFRGEAVTIGPAGNSWIGTAEHCRGPLAGSLPGSAVGDQAVGAVRSRDFRLTGNEISFLVGGTTDPDRLFLALRDARTHAFLARATGTGHERLERRAWRTDAWRGRLVYLEIMDDSPTGHLNLDEIVESGPTARPRPREWFPGTLLDPTPNPFRVGTVASLRIDRPTRLRVSVYDASGRRVRTLFVGAAGAGLLRLAWDGRCESGAHAAAGAYFIRANAGGAVRAVKIVRMP
jgi:hypothetical protein